MNEDAHHQPTDPPPVPPALPAGDTAPTLGEAPHIPAELSAAVPPSGESHSAPHGTVLVQGDASASAASPASAAAGEPNTPPTADIMKRPLLLLGLLIALAMLLVSAGLYAYHIDTFDHVNDARCKVALIIVGIGTTLCLAAAMHLLNKLIELRPRRIWRWLMLLAVRLLMVGQLGATGVALACGGLLLFHKDIPSSDYGAYAPPLAPPANRIIIAPELPDEFVPPPPTTQPPPPPPG